MKKLLYDGSVVGILLLLHKIKTPQLSKRNGKATYYYENGKSTTRGFFKDGN
jgi:antitoxin component YwqK of YwqJK toxin-antitoxin module